MRSGVVAYARERIFLATNGSRLAIEVLSE